MLTNAQYLSGQFLRKVDFNTRAAYRILKAAYCEIADSNGFAMRGNDIDAPEEISAEVQSALDTLVHAADAILKLDDFDTEYSFVCNMS